jgi:hypothetical protein
VDDLNLRVTIVARGSLAWFAQFGRRPTGRASSLAEAEKEFQRAWEAPAVRSSGARSASRTELYSPFADVLNVELRVALRVSPPFASGGGTAPMFGGAR